MFKRIQDWRFAFLLICFLIVVLNPLTNYYYDINFIQGWFQSIGVGNLWVVSPLEGLESILTAKFFYMPSLVGMVIPIVVAVLMGRVFCSWMCPIEFLSLATDKFIGLFFKNFRYRKDKIHLANKVLWFALVTELILTMVIGFPLFVFWSPPGLVGRETMYFVFYRYLALEGIIIVVVLLMNLLTRRLFCRYFCPLGALLALFGRKRQLVIKYFPDRCVDCKICDVRCPMGIKPSMGESHSVYCWNCGECRDSCPTKALRFVWKDDGFIRLKLPINLTAERKTGKIEASQT